jgi:hypothetical protein
MNMKTWLRKHDACPEGYAWAVSTCSTMQDVWDTAQPEWLIWVATRPGVLDDITLRRFACWCARQVWHLLTDERSRHAVETAELFCDGKATLEELAAASDEAWAAATTAAAARIAPFPATRYATIAAANAATIDEVASATLNAACATTWATAWDDLIDGDTAAAFSVQAQWLRANATPNFDD